MRSLCVLYDAGCGVCSRLKTWLVRQPSYVTLRFVPKGSREAREHFPALANDLQDLAVIADSGEVWTGDAAWIICLWALREYRRWAFRFASPSLLPLARQAFLVLSKNRRAISDWLGLQNDAELGRNLSNIPVPPCQIR